MLIIISFSFLNNNHYKGRLIRVVYNKLIAIDIFYSNMETTNKKIKRILRSKLEINMRTGYDKVIIKWNIMVGKGK